MIAICAVHGACMASDWSLPGWSSRRRRVARPSISVSGRGNRLLISVRGDLSEEQLPVLQDVVDAALESVHDADRVEVDLRSASSLDSAGLRLVAGMVDDGIRLVTDDCEADCIDIETRRGAPGAELRRLE